MTRPDRVAIYWAPAPGHALRRFGEDLLAGRRRPAGVAADDWDRLVAEPRRYGFHATIKAPFALADGVDLDRVLTVLARHARAERPFAMPALVVRRIGRFVALVEPVPQIALSGLAARTVVALEPLRGPLTPADRARRGVDALPPDARDRVERWGYPYVFEDFRFHMTLTGPLPDPDPGIADALGAEALADVGTDPLVVDALELVVEDRRGVPFRVAARVRFGDGAIERA